MTKLLETLVEKCHENLTQLSVELTSDSPLRQTCTCVTRPLIVSVVALLLFVDMLLTSTVWLLV